MDLTRKCQFFSAGENLSVKYFTACSNRDLRGYLGNIKLLLRFRRPRLVRRFFRPKRAKFRLLYKSGRA